MNIAVGKISETARTAIVACGGRIEPAIDPEIVMVVLPDNARIINENGGGEHMYIDLDESDEEAFVLHFVRGWKTKDCKLDLCG